jgi:hypothetical protein
MGGVSGKKGVWAQQADSLEMIKGGAVECNTGHVLITAERRPPGVKPKCGVCRDYIAADTPCIKIRAQYTEASTFYLHVQCAGGVLFNLMRAYNYSHNGLSKGKGGAGRTFGALLDTAPPAIEGFAVCKRADGLHVELKKRRGRPPGAKNRFKKPKKRGPGRPKGSKNKPKR